jgi:hypothetical protein
MELQHASVGKAQTVKFRGLQTYGGEHKNSSWGVYAANFSARSNLASRSDKID